MAVPLAVDSLEFSVMRVLGNYVTSKEARSLCLAGDFTRYKLAAKLVAEGGYARPIDFAYDYMCTSLLKKWTGWTSSADKAQKALDSWKAAEKQCYNTNLRLEDEILRGKDPRVLHFVSEVQRKIDHVLGPFRLYKASQHCRWSNGATTLTRRGATVQEKTSAPIAVTRSALTHLKNEIEHDPRWAQSLIGHRPAGPFSLLRLNFEVVEWSRWMTVPKNAEIDRVIKAPVAGNAFLQQGVGRYIRSRLKRFGVDLDDQSINQRGAASALTEGLATLDLSMASDTVSCSLVWLLLPIQWFCYLDDLREKWTQFPDGSKVRLQKFSSMGNAYTFELESLIFWAISDTARELRSSSVSPRVYGDDIIVHQTDAPTVIEWLEWAGFSVNKEKSFLQGPFFESCGEQFYNGYRVTPPYQKEVARVNSEIIRFANRLTRWWMEHEELLDTDKSTALLTAASMIASCWKGRKMPLVPYGDDGFICDRSELAPVDRNHGFRCLVYRYIPQVQSDDIIVVDQYGVARLTSLSYLSLKLRDPRNSYSDRFGRVERVLSGGIWRLTKAWIPDWEPLVEIQEDLVPLA